MRINISDVSTEAADETRNAFTKDISILYRKRFFPHFPPEIALALATQQTEVQEASWRTCYPGMERRVILLGGEPAGRVFLQRRPEEIRIIDITLHPDHQRKGIAEHVIRTLQEGGIPLAAQILQSNAASIALFTKLGFGQTARAGEYLEVAWYAG